MRAETGMSAVRIVERKGMSAAYGRLDFEMIRCMFYLWRKFRAVD